MLELSVYEFAKQVQKIKLPGVQNYTGIQGSSTTQGEQLMNLRRSCGKLLKCVSDNANYDDLELTLRDIDGQVRLAISTGLIGSSDSEGFMKLVDILYDDLEKK